MLPARLVEEVKRLLDEGWAVDLIESEGMACIVFHGFVVPHGYSKAVTDLLLMLPLSYPNGKPDMFWVDVDLHLANGSVPRSADVVQTHLDRQWRRFSWHVTMWNPATDDLRTYLEFVNSRLTKGV